MNNSMNNLIIPFLAVFICLPIMILVMEFRLDRRRFGAWVARRLLTLTAIELFMVCAIVSVLVLFGSAQWESIMNILLWVCVLIRGAQIVSMILNQPRIDESLLDLGAAHGGVGLVIGSALYAVPAALYFVFDSQAPTSCLPLAVVGAISSVYYAARSVRNYAVATDGFWTPENKIRWEQVAICQLDTAPDGTPVLYVQALGGLLWWNHRFAVKVAAKDKAALVAYLERYVQAAQIASA